MNRTARAPVATTGTGRHWPRVLRRTIGCCAAGAVAAWGALALWFQLPFPAAVKLAVIAMWLAVAAVALAAITGRIRLRWISPLLLAWLGLGLWWQTIAPRHDRQWADDVAQLLESEVHGNKVTLRNVRDFNWRSDSDYDARWDSREYDLDRLVSADLFLSYWMGPAIAHTLVSFGFDDGRQLVFSLEIRKERGEEFSAIGGFFKRFEAVVIAAEENDIIRVRTNVRGEDDWLYRVHVSDPQALRQMFLGYLQRARQLRERPQFYNTLSANCTTIIVELARQIDPGLPLDWRVLLTGYFAHYAWDQGALTPGYSYQQLHDAGHITQRARTIRPGQDFSTVIRRGVPGTGVPAAGAGAADPANTIR